MELSINKKDKIHLIGIGGIGMSGIALILKKMGFSQYLKKQCLK